MVLWEITAATAYFLGLKRTYRIALRFQRRIVGPRHTKIRQFLHRRTRGIFEVAVNVHKNIQLRDLETGRNIGSCILRFLDRIKPSAEIRGSAGKQPNKSSSCSTEITTKSANLNSAGKQPNISSTCSCTEITAKSPRLNDSLGGGVHKPSDKFSVQGGGSDDSRQHFTSFCRNFVPSPSIMMMKPAKQTGIYARTHRHDDVFRRDIALWMHEK